MEQTNFKEILNAYFFALGYDKSEELKAINHQDIAGICHIIEEDKENALSIHQHLERNYKIERLYTYLTLCKTGIPIYHLLSFKDFDNDQFEEIRLGCLAGLHVSDYLNPKLSAEKMSVIRSCLKQKTPIPNLFKEFTSEQLYRLKEAADAGMDITYLANPRYQDDQILIAIWAFQDGVNIVPYMHPKFSIEQLQFIKSSIPLGINVKLFAKPEYRIAQMRAIRTALLQKLDYEILLDTDLSDEQLSLALAYLKREWKMPYIKELTDEQIVEVKKGFKDNLDLLSYCNKDFTPAQFNEIRLALKKHIDVETICNPVVSANKMKQYRLSFNK